MGKWGGGIKVVTHFMLFLWSVIWKNQLLNLTGLQRSWGETSSLFYEAEMDSGEIVIEFELHSSSFHSWYRRFDCILIPFWTQGVNHVELNQVMEPTCSIATS